jgi:hypothetical protein
MPARTYADLNALFHALIRVETSLTGLATHLRDDILAHRARAGFRGMVYVPPREVAERTGWTLLPHEIKWREACARHTSFWMDRSDSYWTWCADVWGKISEARASLLGAEPTLDAGIQNPLDKYSTKIHQVLCGAQGSMNYRLSLGWDPFRYPDKAPEFMLAAAEQIFQWVERLRPLAQGLGPGASEGAGSGAQPGEDCGARYMLRLDGEHWVIRYEDEHGILDDFDGFRYLRQLLASPDKKLGAIQLRDSVRAERAAQARARTAMTWDEAQAADLGRGVRQADPVTDAEGVEDLAKEIRATEENINAIRADIAAARESHDEAKETSLTESELKPEIARLQALQARRDADLDHHGKPRSLGSSDVDKARQSVRKGLDSAMSRLKNTLSSCCRHLENSIPDAEGGAFVYRPESSVPWQFE